MALLEQLRRSADDEIETARMPGRLGAPLRALLLATDDGARIGTHPRFTAASHLSADSVGSTS